MQDRSDIDPRGPWYLAQVKPHGLATALRNLDQQQVRHFSPMQRQTNRHGGLFRTREVPVFPGYVFVSPDPLETSFRSLNGTRGISKLVSHGPYPATVPGAVMRSLFARFAPAQGTDTAHLVPGEMVDILDGPLASFAARVEALAPKERVILLLDIMGRPSRVELETRQVRRKDV